MTDIPLPSPGDTSWSDWGQEQEDASDVVLSGRLSDAALGAAYVPQRDVVLAPAPSGGDDSAALAAVMVGARDVHLKAGATYRIDQRDAISATGFTGRVIGNGATLQFAYNGAFSDTYSAINGLTDVTFQNLSITAPNVNLFSVFRNCTNLRLQDVTIYGCSCKLTYAMPRDFSAERIRWITRGANPGTVDGSLYVTDAGRFSLIDFDYDTIFNGGTGAIVSAVSTTPTAGATVYISNGRAMTSDLTGYSIDGFVDIEPVGSVPFESVTVRDCVLFNTSSYLTGAKNIIVENVTGKYTARNTSGRAIPFVIYNHNTTHPAMSSVQIQNCHVEWTNGNPASQHMAVMSYQGQAGAVVKFKSNTYRFNPAGGQVADSLYWVKDGAPAALILDGEVILGVGATLKASGQLIQTDSTPDRLIVRNCTLDGTYNRKLVQTADGGGGSGMLVAYEGNDFSRATFTTTDFRDGSITVTKLRSANNAGIEY